MPYDRQIPDAPISLSMLPRLENLQDGDLFYVVRPTNPIGQRCKSTDLLSVFSSGIGSFVTPILDWGPDSLPQTGPAQMEAICYIDVDPRSQVIFKVWGTSTAAGTGDGDYDYGLCGRVQTRWPGVDTTQRELKKNVYSGSNLHIGGQSYGPIVPTYDAFFSELPYNYDVTPENLQAHPNKRVALSLSSGSTDASGQSNPPATFQLKIQAIVISAPVKGVLEPYGPI
jgi:hypothetical protein